MNYQFFFRHALRLILSLGFLSVAAYATAPKVTATNPGYYRFHLGDFEVTALSDGTFDLPVAMLLPGVPTPELKKLLSHNFLAEKVETSVNAFLVNTGTQLVLIDTGAGTANGPTVGQLLTAMKSAGYKPEQVDAVLITHLHSDHVGGLSTDGKMVFANAVVYAGKGDTDFWLSQAEMDKTPEERKKTFTGAMSALNPYIKAGKLKPLSADTEIMPGIHSHASPGHTPRSHQLCGREAVDKNWF